VWNEFIPSLVPFGRVITVDLRGHGDSDWDATRQYGAQAHLADVSYLLEALGLNKNVVLIGHSVGGGIAIRMTAADSERIIGLIIVDSAPELDSPANAYIRRQSAAERRRYASHADYAAHLKTKLPLIDRKLAERIADAALRLSSRGEYELKYDPAMHDVLPAGDSRSNLWPMLHRIRCPVLIIRGIASSVLPHSVAQRMIDILPNASLASVKLAGHAVMIENPARFAAAAVAFLTRHFGFQEPEETQAPPIASTSSSAV
jgi:pimeloyl-ACP methyl ester carboxylesterase